VRAAAELRWVRKGPALRGSPRHRIPRRRCDRVSHPAARRRRSSADSEARHSLLLGGTNHAPAVTPIVRRWPTIGPAGCTLARTTMSSVDRAAPRPIVPYPTHERIKTVTRSWPGEYQEDHLADRRHGANKAVDEARDDRRPDQREDHAAERGGRSSLQGGRRFFQARVELGERRPPRCESRQAFRGR